MAGGAREGYCALSPEELQQTRSRRMRAASAALCALAFILAAAAGCVGVAVARRGSPMAPRSLRNEPAHSQEAVAPQCEEGKWEGHGRVCGGCRVLVEKFGTDVELERRRLRDAGVGTCKDYCHSVGHACRGAWHAIERGSCSAVWELELTCDEELAANQTVCFCGDKLPGWHPTKPKEHDHIARAVHHEHKNKTEAEHKSEHVKQLRAKVHFPKPPPCNQFEVDTDFWTKAMLWTVPKVVSVEKCNEHCELEPRCGAWTWGKKRDIPGLSDVCFLKVVAEDGTFKRADKDGVVSGVRSEQRLCTASEMAEFLEETAAAKKAQAELKKAQEGDGGKKASGETKTRTTRTTSRPRTTRTRRKKRRRASRRTRMMTRRMTRRMKTSR